MTALASLVPAPGRDHQAASLPWRRMAWVTWRQHRTALVGLGIFMTAMAGLVVVAGVKLHHAYGAAVTCHPSASFACASLANAFDGTNDFLANGGIFQVMPPAIGAFIGAPILAREIESGTYRFAWTQGFGRWRWTIAKLVGLGAIVVGVAGVMAALTTWYFAPYFAVNGGSDSLSNDGLRGASPFFPGLFDLHGVTLVAWSLAAFAIGVLAGAVIGRVVPAIVAALVTYGAMAFAVGSWLRPRYLAPLVTDGLRVPPSAWVVSEQWMKGGRPVPPTVIDQVLASGGAQVVGKGGIPKSDATTQFLAHHGIVQLVTYQPLSRFWPFQWIETGWLLGFSLLCLAATLWFIRRRSMA